MIKNFRGRTKSYDGRGWLLARGQFVLGAPMCATNKQTFMN